MFLSLMSSFSSLPTPPMIVALQDPPLRNGKLPSFSTWKCFHPPHKHPRVAFFVHPYLIASTSILPVPSPSADLFWLDIFAPLRRFDFSFPRFRVTNAYSTHQRSPPYCTLTPQDLLPCLPFPLLVLGDLNIHQSSSDPLRVLNPRELSVSHPYFSLASERDFSLLNQPGVYTYFPFTHSSRPSVLDLALANFKLTPAFSKWDTPLPSTGSDHVPVIISFCSPKFRPPDPSLNWAKTDWDTILPQLHCLVPPPPPPSCPVAVFEDWSDTHSSRVKTLIISNTPTSRPSPRSKPWWSPLLSSLRQAFHSASRSYRASRDPYDHSAMRSARRSYFGAIKKAKFSHWAEYLSSLSPSSVWEAKKLASRHQQPRFPSFPDKDTPDGINTALLDHFFPAPPSPALSDVNLSAYSDYFLVSQEEITSALAKSSSSAANGPDTISYGVWKKVHKSCPALLMNLIGPLLQYGHHPSSLKKANGVVLDKPGKASYDSPVPFRIIVLLETLSKIVKRVTASRLSLLARSCSLLHTHQTRSLPGLSTFDATATFAHEVRFFQRLDLKVSSLFLAIKGGFDNVDPSQLTAAVRAKGVHR